METMQVLWDAARVSHKRAMPILSFPAVQKMNVTVERLVKSAELQAQAMELVARETPTCASVSLMDLSVEAEAFGAQVRFSQGEVPAIIGQLVPDEAAARALVVPGPERGRAGICAEAIRLAKQRIKDKPVLAGMIGPYSLAGRLMDVTEIMYACYDEPETVRLVLEKVTAYLLEYGRTLARAGADGIVMAEPLAGLLNAEMAAEFSVPYVKRIVLALQAEGCAVIYHNCGNSTPSMLKEIFSQGASAYHFGNSVDMAAILQQAPEDALCMGNVDPAGQFANGTPESIAAATRELLSRCGGHPNFVPSSGCDIPAHAKWENIQAFFRAVEEGNR